MRLDSRVSFDSGRWMCTCAVPAEANVLVTCRRLSNDEPEVVEIHRDDTASSAAVVTTEGSALCWTVLISSQFMSLNASQCVILYNFSSKFFDRNEM